MTNHLSKSKEHIAEATHCKTGMARELSGLSSWLRCLQATDNAVKNNKMASPILRYGFLPNTKVPLDLDK